MSATKEAKCSGSPPTTSATATAAAAPNVAVNATATSAPTAAAAAAEDGRTDVEVVIKGLITTVEQLLSAMDATDVSWTYGMTETALKHLVFAILRLSLPANVTVESERRMRNGTFADLMVTEKRWCLVIELKAVALEFVSSTPQRASLTTRADMTSMSQWLAGLSSTEVQEKLWICTHTTKAIVSPKIHVENAFQQAVGYATAMLKEEDDATTVVVAMALVTIGQRVLTKAGRVMI